MTAFVINLSRDIERRHSVKEQLDGLGFLRVVTPHGVEGKTVIVSVRNASKATTKNIFLRRPAAVSLGLIDFDGISDEAVVSFGTRNPDRRRRSFWDPLNGVPDH